MSSGGSAMSCGSTSDEHPIRPHRSFQAPPRYGERSTRFIQKMPQTWVGLNRFCGHNPRGTLTMHAGRQPPMSKQRSLSRRRDWTMLEVKKLRHHSVAGTPVSVIADDLRRSVSALRQKAYELGIPLGSLQRSNRQSALLSSSSGGDR